MQYFVLSAVVQARVYKMSDSVNISSEINLNNEK